MFLVMIVVADYQYVITTDMVEGWIFFVCVRGRGALVITKSFLVTGSGLVVYWSISNHQNSSIWY